MVSKIEIKEGSGGGDFKKATPGYQTARLLRIIDTGVQAQEYKGEKKPPKTVLQFIFELSEDTVIVNGEELPMLAFSRAAITGGNPTPSTLEKILKALGADPKNADLASLLGRPVGLTFDERGFISSFSPLIEKKAAMVPKLEADSFFFDFDAPDAKVLKKLGKKTIERLKDALNFSGSKVEKLLESNEIEVTESTGEEVI